MNNEVSIRRILGGKYIVSKGKYKESAHDTLEEAIETIRKLFNNEIRRGNWALLGKKEGQ